ncbi:hypothetical protein BU15DRAFT_65683 [Melanogaster broomeanus]|nr:hypothetical protein BU15DRAFT_65683 [Melanogaster broomeanus]
MPKTTEPPSLNVVVFGHTGAGVSSLVNLIVGRNDAKVAKVVGDSKSTTRKAACYSTSIGGRLVKVHDIPAYDVVGVGHWEAKFPASANLIIVCSENKERRAVAAASRATQLRVSRYHNAPVILVASHQGQGEHQGKWATTASAHFEVVPGVLAQEVVTQPSMDSDATRALLHDLISKIQLRSQSLPVTFTGA